MPQKLEHSGTSWRGQQLKHQHSMLDAVDPRARVLAVTAFAFATVLSEAFPSLLLALAIAFALCAIARLNIRRTLRRVAAMDLFMIFLLVTLPFTTPITTPDDVWFEVSGMSASWLGFEHALKIMLKANAVVLALLSLVGTLPATNLGIALAQLKVPEKLVHLMLFTVRYLDVIGQEYKRMRRAMQARAFVLKANRHTWRSVGYLVGMLLVHSIERSERISDAMKCRGYCGRFYLPEAQAFSAIDFRFALVSLVTVCAVVMVSYV